MRREEKKSGAGSGVKFPLGTRVEYRIPRGGIGNTDLDGRTGVVVYIDSTACPYTVRLDERYPDAVSECRIGVDAEGKPASAHEAPGGASCQGEGELGTSKDSAEGAAASLHEAPGGASCQGEGKLGTSKDSAEGAAASLHEAPGGASCQGEGGRGVRRRIINNCWFCKEANLVARRGRRPGGGTEAELAEIVAEAVMDPAGWMSQSISARNHALNQKKKRGRPRGKEKST